MQFTVSYSSLRNKRLYDPRRNVSKVEKGRVALSEPAEHSRNWSNPQAKCGVITRALLSDSQAFAYGASSWKRQGCWENQSQGIRQFAQRLAHTRWLLFILPLLSHP